MFALDASENNKSNKVDQRYRIGKHFVASACRKTSFNSVNDITEEMILKFHPVTEALLSITVVVVSLYLILRSGP